MVFDDAVLKYCGGLSGGSRQWGTVLFFSNVTFRGSTPYVLNTNGANCFFAFGKHAPSVVSVEDITGNASPDVTMALPLKDVPHTSASIRDGVDTSFVKAGPGTLRLASAASTFSGNIGVSEGVLEAAAGNAVTNAAKGSLGNPQTNRQIRVQSGAALSLLVSDVFGQLSSTVKSGLAVSNATLKLNAGTCNVFGPLSLYNATVSYSSGASGSRLWGVLGFGGRTVFGGTEAYAFPSNGSACVFNLGYALNTVKESDTLYAGQTELEVRDITGNEDPDVTFAVPLQNIPDWPSGGSIFYRCGLLNSGAGTLRLAGANTFSGATLVTQGVLRVDGQVTNSPITVAPGAYLAGTGTVGNVTVADGAGFEVFATQTEPLKARAFTAGGGGRIIVRNPTGLSPEALNVPFLQIPEALREAFNPLAWTVTMDGADPETALAGFGHRDDRSLMPLWAGVPASAVRGYFENTRRADGANGERYAILLASEC